MSYKSVISIDGLYAAAQLEDKDMAEQWEERLELIKHKVKFVKNRPNIVCLENIDPLLVSGKWIPELIYNAGGQALYSEMGADAKEISIEELQKLDADGIIISIPEKTLVEAKEIVLSVLNTEVWQGMRAVQKGHVFVADGEKYFHTPGEGLIETGELIAEILQVNQFYYGMEGESWEQISQKL